MSSNVDLSFQVYGSSSEGQAVSMCEAIMKVLRGERLDLDVVLGAVEIGGQWVVVGQSHGPMIVSGFYDWHGGFESSLRRCVEGVSATARVTVDWGFPDES